MPRRPAVLVAWILLAAPPAPADEQSRWTAGRAILTQSKVNIGVGDRVVGVTSDLNVTVLAVQGQFLKIRDQRGIEGWIDKPQAVPLAEAIDFFTNKLQADGDED